jgi:translation initiation factor 1A
MSKKGKGGKKHRRGKNISTDIKIDIPDEYQYFAYVNKILGSGRVNLDYYIPKFNENTNEIIDWDKKTKIGVIRGKMMRRVYVNLGDLVLITERDFDDSKVDIIDKYQTTQFAYLKKYANLPPINDILDNDVEFDFDDNNANVVNDTINKLRNTKNDDYMSGIPTFSDEDDNIEKL